MGQQRHQLTSKAFLPLPSDDLIELLTWKIRPRLAVLFLLEREKREAILFQIAAYFLPEKMKISHLLDT